MSYPEIHTKQADDIAILHVNGHKHHFNGKWINGGPWERFGLYNRYVAVREDGAVAVIPAHAGELVPGSTEDLIYALNRLEDNELPSPMTLELDPTNICYSKDCGGHCFSAEYRALNPKSSIPGNSLVHIIQDFAQEGGRIVRFDGGGDPLAHPDVRNAKLPQLAHDLGLKSTILTSGDALLTTKLKEIVEAGTYLRFSLNAAEDKTRMKFHGNRMKLSTILKEIEKLTSWMQKTGINLPIASTFLIGKENFEEIYKCASLAKEVGINHFSARRVLGPATMRPTFSVEEEQSIQSQLIQVLSLKSDDFRVFVPWRSIQEGDLNPAAGDFSATQCWQSTFKTIIEPGEDESFKIQLCGRYRGSGYGQKMQLDPIKEAQSGENWVESWRDSFRDYPYSRSALIQTCSSCIDRGFISMIDRLVAFLKPSLHNFAIFHLYEPPGS